MARHCPVTDAVEEAKQLTIGFPTEVAANNLLAGDWLYIGRGAYKSAVAKDGVVVKIAGVFPVFDPGETTNPAFFKSGHNVDGGQLLRRRLTAAMTESVDDLYAYTDEPNYMDDGKRLMKAWLALPHSQRKLIATPLFVWGNITCQLMAPGTIKIPPGYTYGDPIVYCSCEKNNRLRETTDIIYRKTNVFFMDVGTGFGHNHGHLKDGTPVIYDG